MRIFAGLQLGGAALTPFDDLEPGRGSIGEVAWSAAELLRDLELRLGIGTEVVPGALRTAIWAERMARVAPLGRFYSRSFEVDPLSTAQAVLGLRDLLVGSEWDGQSIADGGPRLEAICELEAAELPVLPLGVADRVARVARTLEQCRSRLYAEVTLAERAELWPLRWRRVFESLVRTGTSVRTSAMALPGATPDTDLGKVQTALSSHSSIAAVTFRGDGTFVRLTAETSWEAARATAAVLPGLARRTVIVREDDVSPLDNALLVQGLSSQGWRSRSPWRAALQVLPLALELAFEPKDPYRVLELLTLPVGPFQGLSGHRLARALSESPGIGGREWEAAKAELEKHAATADLPAKIHEWFEQPGVDRAAAAPKAVLLAVVARVRAWVVARIAGAPDDAMLLAAVGQADALRVAIESDPRSDLSLVEVRRLAESVLASGTTAQLEEERTGRVDHVSAPAGLRVPRENLVWWSFVDRPSKRSALPWRRQELAALARVGVLFPDPRALLAQRATDWRCAILAATERVILVTPRNAAGEALSPHPLWDEIVARTGTDDAARARIEMSAADLLASPPRQSLLRAPLDALAPAPLPGGQPVWMIPEGVPPDENYVSAASLNELLSCPLRWALHYGAGLREAGHALPPLVLLNGKLGHRLVEVLQADGGFGLEEAELERRANAELERLFQREGSLLLRPGMAFDRGQFRRQLVGAVVELSRNLRASGLRIVSVEQAIDATWRGRELRGRFDLVVAAEDGTRAILDLKWGYKSYRDRLQAGQELQLAVYAYALAEETGSAARVDAAFFSLSRGKLFGLPSRFFPQADALEGPSLAETWQKVERSVVNVERHVAQGTIPVAGVRRARPLLEVLGVAEAERAQHFAIDSKLACEYCEYDAICGRRWEAAS